jgi:hypothetical protein
MRLFLLAIAVSLSIHSFAQNSVAGSWYGKAEALSSGTNNSYLTELILKQKGNEIEGVFGYYFRNGYKSVFIRGLYNKKTRKVEIKNVPVTYFKASDIDGVDCHMDMEATLLISKVSNSLKGSLLSHDKYKYTCPELSFYYTLDNSEGGQDELIKNSITRKLWQPRPQDVIVTSNKPVQKKDTASGTITASVFEKRDDVVAERITVSSDSLRISFYDNGEIDGDSISVFLNNVPILVHQELTSEAINIYVKLDSSIAVNEITMYAENLGKYPPNTALMVVNDGEERHEIYISSSLTQNATVRIRRK